MERVRKSSRYVPQVMLWHILYAAHVSCVVRFMFSKAKLQILVRKYFAS
jgi:hypothetical protein